MTNQATYTGIHSTVPEEVTQNPGVTLEYDENRERILIYLMSKNEYVTAWKINQELQIEKDNKTFPVTRKLIKEINYFSQQKGMPFGIISDNKGFKYTQEATEVWENIERLENRMKGLKESIEYQRSIYLRLKK